MKCDKILFAKTRHLERNINIIFRPKMAESQQLKQIKLFLCSKKVETELQKEDGMIFLNTHIQSKSSIEETDNLASNMTMSCLLMGENSLVGGDD